MLPYDAMLTLLLLAQSVRGDMINASSHLADWSGRSLFTSDGGGVMFDWLGVTARVQVTNATYVGATIATTANRGTRLKAYASGQGFILFPQVQFWVDPRLTSPYTLWLSPNPESTIITLENMVAPQYSTGTTSVLTFETDGTFKALAPTDRLGGATNRRIEFVGDSITAATNIVRPEGATHYCGDGGYQSDWSQTYEALLCHRFGASCSTVAVGGKCMMRECGGLQMPDYYLATMYADAPQATYNFSAGWVPDAVFIDLGTNDMRAISKLGPSGMTAFANQTVNFMLGASARYGSRDIEFFLNAGPMENATMEGTLSAVAQASAAGLRATFVDMRGACAGARLHQPDDSDQCDGCAGHPGIEGHRGMYEAAWPVMAKVMGWDSFPPPTSGP
jgi:hypothetical protein